MAKQKARSASPKLRFPEFMGAPLWSEKVLGDEGEFLSPLTGKTAQHFGTGNAKYVTYMNVFANTFTDMATLGVVDVKGGESQNAVEQGDVLFTVSSETPEEVGMSSVVIDAVPNCYVNSFCAMFRFNDGSQPNLRFLGYSLRQPFTRHYLVKRAQGSTRFNLSKPAFRSLPLVLPAAAEQKRIADCLTSLDEVIAAQRRKVAALKAHKRGLMQQLFPREGETRPRLRFPEFRKAPEWRATSVGAWSKSFSGGTPATTRSDYYGGTIPFIRSAEIGSERPQLSLTETGLKASSAKLVERGDVLLALYGANSGDVALARTPGAINQAILCIRPDGSKPFLYHYLTVLQPWLVATYLQGGQGNLSGEIVKSVGIRVPSGEEQQRVAACLTSLDARITSETDRLAALKTHKQGLMQQLFPAPEAMGA